MYDLGWLWMAWMFIIRNSIGCGQCLRSKMLSDIFSFSFTLFLPNWLLISIRIYSGIARFPCDSMAFLFFVKFVVFCAASGSGYFSGLFLILCFNIFSHRLCCEVLPPIIVGGAVQKMIWFVFGTWGVNQPLVSPTLFLPSLTLPLPRPFPLP